MRGYLSASGGSFSLNFTARLIEINKNKIFSLAKHHSRLSNRKCMFVLCMLFSLAFYYYCLLEYWKAKWNIFIFIYISVTTFSHSSDLFFSSIFILLFNRKTHLLSCHEYTFLVSISLKKKFCCFFFLHSDQH